MLVKELRQGTRTRMFAAAFIIVQAILALTILTALGACHEADAVAVVACDLLAPSSHEIRLLTAEIDGGDVVVPVVADRPQWTHAIWSRRARTTLEAAFAAGERAPRNAVGDLSVRRVDIDAARAHAYADADTPDDLPGGATR